MLLRLTDLIFELAIVPPYILSEYHDIIVGDTIGISIISLFFMYLNKLVHAFVHKDNFLFKHSLSVA